MNELPAASHLNNPRHQLRGARITASPATHFHSSLFRIPRPGWPPHCAVADGRTPHVSRRQS